MNTNDRPSNNTLHEKVLTLLPWYVNGTLEGDKRAWVQAHLGNCPLCRREAAALNRLAEQMRQAAMPETSPQAAFTRFSERIKPQELSESSRKPPLRLARTRRIFEAARTAGRTRWAPLAMAAALLLMILPLGLQKIDRMAEPSFRTLSDHVSQAESPKGDLRVVFAPDVGIGRIDALLDAVGGRRIDGPSPAGVYSVRLGGGEKRRLDIDASIAFLRNQEEVMFVEPAVRP